MRSLRLFLICFAIGYLLAIGLLEFGSFLQRVSDERTREIEEQTSSFHRPTACRHLYDTGQSAYWFDCMGVGYAPSNHAARIEPRPLDIAGETVPGTPDGAAEAARVSGP